MNIYPLEGDNPSKGGLIPRRPFFLLVKGHVLWLPMDEFASYQLVGGVRAYQGKDG